MATVDIGTKEDLAKELHELSMRACRMEDFVRHAESVMIAIENGGLLDAAPADEDAYEAHSAATTLLARLLDDIRRLNAEPGTDLSISLSCCSRDVQEGVYAHKRVLE